MTLLLCNGGIVFYNEPTDVTCTPEDPEAGTICEVMHSYYSLTRFDAFNPIIYEMGIPYLVMSNYSCTSAYLLVVLNYG